MKLSDKLRYLREVEGSLRGMGRALTQQELLRAIERETGERLSQSYLSQIESGKRPHLTNTTRLMLARFFRIHPGYLVEDPEGYSAELLSPLRTQEDRLDLWLLAGSDRFHRDAELCRALRAVARHADSRRCLLLLESVLETPELLDRLMEVLRPVASGGTPARIGAESTILPRKASGASRSVERSSATPVSAGRKPGKRSAAKAATKKSAAKESAAKKSTTKKSATGRRS